MNTARLGKHSVALVAAGALLLAGCSSSPPAAQPSATGSPVAVAGDAVGIDNFAFAPATLRVRAGGTVTWTNRDEEPHTVASDDGSFHSPAMRTGATYSHTFPTAGRFDYACSIHPMMHGTVVVTG